MTILACHLARISMDQAAPVLREGHVGDHQAAGTFSY